MALLLIGLARSASAKQEETQLPPVSVIVSARNEEIRIERCLNALVQQQYPGPLLEIIVVDDRSTDKTSQIIKSMASEFRSIRPIRIKKRGLWTSAKKSALSAGSARACGSILLFTDADCIPPPAWVESVVRQYRPGIGMVAGFSPQDSDGSKRWNGFLFIDSLASAVVAAGSIGWGRGLTCTGRNLSCQREALDAIGRYDSLPDSVSGDDDFLLQAISRHPAWKAAYSFARESQVPAAGPGNLKKFLQQKRRHLSAGKYFTLGSQIGYGLYHFSNYGIWLISVFSVLGHLEFLVPLCIKIGFDWVALNLMARKLGTSCRFWDFMVWEVLFPLYHLISGPGAFWGRISWKPEMLQPV